MASLPEYISRKNDTAFQQSMLQGFEGMDSNSDGYITPADLYQGLLSSLLPERKRLGFSMLAVCIIVAAFSVIYGVWYKHLDNSTSFRDSILIGKSSQPFLSIEDDDYDNDDSSNEFPLESGDHQSLHDTGSLSVDINDDDGGDDDYDNDEPYEKERSKKRKDKSRHCDKSSKRSKGSKNNKDRKHRKNRDDDEESRTVDVLYGPDD